MFLKSLFWSNNFRASTAWIWKWNQKNGNFQFQWHLEGRYLHVAAEGGAGAYCCWHFNFYAAICINEHILFELLKAASDSHAYTHLFIQT